VGKRAEERRFQLGMAVEAVDGNGVGQLLEETGRRRVREGASAIRCWESMPRTGQYELVECN
jgi:hypothetical protein